jgi:hypothetical protein
VTRARHRWRHHRPSGAPGAARALLAVLLIASLHLTPASAQPRQPSIVVAPQLRIAPGAEAPFPIAIVPPGSVPPASFIRLRGLPPTAALSNGYSIAPGAWSIPVTALPKLMILVPGNTPGGSDFSIALVSRDGATLAEATSTLVVAARSAPAAATVLHAAPAWELPSREPGAAAPPPRLSAEARAHALRLVEKGDEQLAYGGVAQARLLYERAAEAGLPEGAMAMAATYDAAELARIDALGVPPDPAAARHWYERARQLGAPEAEARLRRLGAN